MRVRVIGLLVLALLAPSVPVGAHNDDYQDVMARLERARRLVAQMEDQERGLRSEIAATDARRRAVEIELEELGALVAGAESELQDAEAVLGRIQSELDQRTTNLQAKLEELQATHELLTERAVHVYMNGPASMLELLLGAVSFRDLVGRAQFVFRVFDRDQDQLTDLRRQKAEIAKERDEVQALRDRAAAQVAVVRRERDRVAAIHNGVAARRNALSGELREAYGDLRDVQGQKAVYLRQQQELEAESRRVASFLRGHGGGPATVSKGGMAWPTSGPVTSGYGYRTHPIFGTQRFHSGIDIGAPSGQSVVASAPGTVVYAGVKGGYGNTVIVDHGGGVATLYAHLSSIGAGVGRRLEGRQYLGRVGCTGYCTGPHLHFEVRVNGEPQNPMSWLG